LKQRTIIKRRVAKKRLRSTVMDEERLLAKSTRPSPSHSIKRVSKPVLLRFRQEDISQKVFNSGALHLCRGLDILKFEQNCFIMLHISIWGD